MTPLHAHSPLTQGPPDAATAVDHTALDAATAAPIGLHDAAVLDAVAPVPSSALLQGRRCVEITHNGSVYRLSATRMGKLILTK